MAKDDRYRLAKSLIESGGIKNVRDLLGILDKTPLAKDIKVTPERFNKLIDNPVLFMMQDCIGIAEVIGVDPKLIIDIVYAEIMSKKKKRR
jgi:hypothetical protein